MNNTTEQTSKPVTYRYHRNITRTGHIIELDDQKGRAHVQWTSEVYLNDGHVNRLDCRTWVKLSALNR